MLQFIHVLYWIAESFVIRHLCMYKMIKDREMQQEFKWERLRPEISGKRSDFNLANFY